MNTLTQSASLNQKTSLTTRCALPQGGEKIGLVTREFISRSSKRSVFPSLKMLSANDYTIRLEQSKERRKTLSWTTLSCVQGGPDRTRAQGTGEDHWSVLTLENLTTMCKQGLSVMELDATHRSLQFTSMSPT